MIFLSLAWSVLLKRHLRIDKRYNAVTDIPDEGAHKRLVTEHRLCKISVTQRSNIAPWEVNRPCRALLFSYLDWERHFSEKIIFVSV